MNLKVNSAILMETNRRTEWNTIESQRIKLNKSEVRRLN